MSAFLVLRFEAPLMSFGAVVVDQKNPTWRHPSLSQVTGLLANALGWDHADADRLQALQDNLLVGARTDAPGERLLDFQTVELGQKAGDFEWLQAGWTTRGAIMERAGGPEARLGTHIRYREYLADARYTVVVGLRQPGVPSLDDLEAALAEPARPLFFGRKPCLPSGPILQGRVEATNVLQALSRAPGAVAGAEVWWPDGEGELDDARLLRVPDLRDWTNQIHSGRRRVRHGRLLAGGVSDG